MMPLNLSSLCGTPIMQMLACFTLSQRLHVLPSIFSFVFLSAVLIGLFLILSSRSLTHYSMYLVYYSLLPRPLFFKSQTLNYLFFIWSIIFSNSLINGLCFGQFSFLIYQAFLLPTS